MKRKCIALLIFILQFLALPFTVFANINTIRAISIEHRVLIDSNDAGFIREMAVYNLMEIQIALLAIEKSKKAEVKTLAETLSKFHKRIETDLKNLSLINNYTYSDDLTTKCKEKIDKLFNTNSPLFEKNYLKLANDNYQKLLEICAEAENKSKDNNIKTFAHQYAAEIRTHNAAVRLLTKATRTASNK